MTHVAGAWSVPFLVAATIAFTWPLGDLRQPQLPAHDDALFSVWRLAWISHQLVDNPSQLFDANIFWPEPHTLAFSDAMLLLGIAAAPLIRVGLHPIAVHNLLLLASFVCAGLATQRLLAHLKAGPLAQLVGALVFAFAPYRVAHLGHLELLWTAFLPLSLLCLYRALEVPALRRGLALGLMVALQGLCSIYYFVFLIIWLIPATLLARWQLTFTWSRRHAIAAAGALVTIALSIGPYAYVYTTARQNIGATRSETEIERYSATARDYLAVPPSNRLYGREATASTEERSLFVGAIAVALAVLSVIQSRTRLSIAFAILGAIAVDLSLGVNGVTYNALRTLVPPLDGFRAPARFGVFVLLSVAVLAGIGMQRLTEGIHRASLRHTIAALLVVGLFAEYWSAPTATAAQPLEPPAVYKWLAAQPRTVTLELPMPTPEALWKVETTYEYFSLYHWQPLVNGYSGYAPPSYLNALEAMRDFPSARALQFLTSRGVGLVLLHERYMQPHEFDRMLAACADTQWFRDVRVFDEGSPERSAACRLHDAETSPMALKFLVAAPK